MRPKSLAVAPPHRLFLYLPFGLVLGLAGCGFTPPVEGPMQTDPVHVTAKNADHANVELDIGAGELKVHGGAQNLLDGAFHYNINGYKPVVDSSVNGSHAVVTIRQTNHNHFGDHGHNLWDLQLNNSAVLDLAVRCGAGQAELNLGNMALRTLDVQMGAGQVDLDLRGSPQRDYEVNISGGVGQANVWLPQGVGIRADAHGGLGSIDVTGLNKQGDHYENDLYDKSKHNIRLNVEGGIGQISIHG
jgi:hypothetical protein